ncbi:MAG TPA: RNA-binding S4 domain-containing protein [Erysipelotrichaceae bacterium]|nr:RNA-binding S4 domain-containing protein [Erysipelotrichaceae bacterium]
MRIDKYLKVSRILKRRTISKELAENERIEINGRIVKPSHEVKAGDIVRITFGNRRLEVRVLSVAEVKKKQEAQEMYEIINEERISLDDQKQE